MARAKMNIPLTEAVRRLEAKESLNHGGCIAVGIAEGQILLQNMDGSTFWVDVQVYERDFLDSPVGRVSQMQTHKADPPMHQSKHKERKGSEALIEGE